MPELASGPVVGIAEAAMHAATLLGRGFSVVTTLGRTGGRAWDLAHHYGFGRQCRAPVVDGVAAGTLLVQSLVTLGLRTGTTGSGREFSAPPPKPYTGLLKGFGS
jgi:allantoin racemase